MIPNIVTVWLRKNKITVLLWPSMSPKWKNIWQGLKVRKKSRSAKSLLELERVTILKIEENPRKDLFKSPQNFRKRLQQDIKMRGHAIDYCEDCFGGGVVIVV